MQKKIQAILVDDEVNNLEYLQSLIQKNCPQIEINATYTSATAALQAMQNQQPQLVFMDIDMPELTGFELLKKLEPLQFEVIFVTAYNQYALEAFEHNAVGYVTKPIASNKLLHAIDKAIIKIEAKNYTQNLFSLLENVHPKSDNDKIALPTLMGLQFVKLSQILYCESSGNYTQFYLLNKLKILVSRQLGEYEKLLPPDTFVRIHDKYIINLTFINEYIKGSGGEVVLENSTHLPVAVRRKDELLSRFEKWLRRK